MLRSSALRTWGGVILLAGLTTLWWLKH